MTDMQAKHIVGSVLLGLCLIAFPIYLMGFAYLSKIIYSNSGFTFDQLLCLLGMVFTFLMGLCGLEFLLGKKQ